jgi:hypothetical protein
MRRSVQEYDKDKVFLQGADRMILACIEDDQIFSFHPINSFGSDACANSARSPG